MNFKINCQVLLESINIVQKGLPVKTPLPILTGIKVDVYQNHIILTASNMEMLIQVKIQDPSLSVSEQGKIIIPGKFFSEIIRKINSKNVEISVIDNRIVLIKAERSEFKLNVMDYDDYPSLEFLKSNEKISLKASDLKLIIREVNFACSTSEKRPILTGVNFKSENNTLSCIATDSFRLSKKSIELGNIPSFNIVIPSRSLEEYSKIIENYDGNITVYIKNNNILFEYENISFQSRLLEGNYPDTSKLIPQEFPVIINFNKDELLLAMDRVSLLSPKEKDRNYNIVQLFLLNSKVVQITSNNSEIGDALEEIVLDEEAIGPVIRIAFSSRYLIEALKSLSSNNISLNFTGELKPFIIKGEKDSNLIDLILPVKLD